MVSNLSKEVKLYPMVEKWMKKHFQCFQTSKNTGLIHGRIDVVGVRDVGGDLAGDIETISIEVKRGTEAFVTACGQALGYKIYANRAYLADIRSDSFSHDEIKIASHLGIGLIQIKNRKCQEILSSPFYTPMISHNLSLLEKLALGKCQICGSFFTTGNIDKKYNHWENLSRVMDTSYDKDKGFWWWLYEIGERRNKISGKLSAKGISDRRFICPDCVNSLF